MFNFLVLIILSLSYSCLAADVYYVEHSIDDEVFIINSSVYKAQTYCFNINKGDRVIFVEGSAYGACFSAEFIDLDSEEKCSVWCE